MTRIVRGRMEDWSRFRDVRLRALHTDPDSFGSRYEDEARQPDPFWKDRLAALDVVQLLATLDDADVGITVVAPARWTDDGAGAIFSVWVAPEARGHGIGDALMTEAIEQARTMGYPRLVLEVGAFNVHARALYARAGFVDTGRTTTLPPPRDHVIEREMARTL